MSIQVPEGRALTAQVVDVTGRMMSLPQFLHPGTTTLDVHALPPGVYLLRAPPGTGATHIYRVSRYLDNGAWIMTVWVIVLLITLQRPTGK